MLRVFISLSSSRDASWAGYLEGPFSGSWRMWVCGGVVGEVVGGVDVTIGESLLGEVGYGGVGA